MSEPSGAAKRAASTILSDVGVLGKTRIRKHAALIDAAINAAVAMERESCAEIADKARDAVIESAGLYDDDARMCAVSIAELIRARRSV